MKKINIGDAPNDGTGDPLRNAVIKVNENFDEVNFEVLPENKIGGTGTLTPTFWPAVAGAGILESMIVNNGLYSDKLPYKRNHLGTAASGNCFLNKSVPLGGTKPHTISLGFWLQDVEVEAIFTTLTTTYQFWLYEGVGICVSAIQLRTILSKIGNSTVQAFNSVGRIAGNMVATCLD